MSWSLLCQARRVQVAVHVVVPPRQLPAPAEDGGTVMWSTAMGQFPSLASQCCPCERCSLLVSVLCCVRTSPPPTSCTPPSDGCGLRSVSVPLRCPLRRATPFAPARLLGCQHLDRFDCFAALHQWLHRLEGYDWDDFVKGVSAPLLIRCPCCGMEARISVHAPPMIVMDGWLHAVVCGEDSANWVIVQDDSGVVTARHGDEPARCPRMSVVSVGDA
jgi:hypothetical protein